MEFNSRTEFAIFFYTLHHPELINKCQKDFFSDDTTKGLYEISAPFVTKYKKCPTAEEVKQMILNSDWTPQQKDKINDEVVDLLWRDSETYKTIYDPVWMKNQVEAFYRYQTLMKGIRETISYVKLNSENFTIENCREMSDKVQNMFDKKTSIEFDDVNTSIHTIDDPESVYSPDLQRFQTGDEFIDRVSGGGYWPGSLWAFLGAPKAGKSRLLQNLCVTAYKQCYNVAYISLELPYTLISQRISSNLYNIEMKTWYDKDFIQNKYADVIKDYKSKHPTAPTMSIQDYGTGTLAVSQLEHNLLQQEKIFSERTGKEFKFKCVYVDYINIMKNWKNPDSENTYLKIKQIAEDLRAMAKRNNWCIVTATQTKSTFFDSETINMQSAAESSALQATVDMMFGIISTPEMHQDHEQYLKIILNRVEYYTNYKQKYDINEKYMRLVKANEDMIFDDGITTISKPKKITKKTIEASDKKQLESQNEAKLIANAQELLFK
jgi:archaellum biogenesis ATPase FlaH